LIIYLVFNFETLKAYFIVNTNTVIRALSGYIEGKRASMLFKLMGNPIFNFYVPLEIESEVLKYINTNKKINTKNGKVDKFLRLA
jgi:hypothetical protein